MWACMSWASKQLQPTFLEKCKCGAFFDKQGHHIQNCKTLNRVKWHRAHTLVLNEWKSVSLTASVTWMIEPSSPPRQQQKASIAKLTSCLA